MDIFGNEGNDSAYFTERSLGTSRSYHTALTHLTGNGTWTRTGNGSLGNGTARNSVSTGSMYRRWAI